MTAAAIYLGLLFARVGAFAAVAPPFAGRAPRSVRVGLAVVLTAFYAVTVAPRWDPAFAAAAAELPTAVYALALAREALLGAAMGFAFGLFLLPARVAGEFITQQIGLNVSPSAGPTGTDSAGALTNLFETAAALLFLLSDLHHVALAALHSSFALFPLGGMTLPRVGPMTDGLAVAYETGLLLAGPLALSLFLLAVTMAVMARAAPQLNVYSVGFTLQILVVLVGGLFLLPEVLGALHAGLLRAGADLPRLLGG